VKDRNDCENRRAPYKYIPSQAEFTGAGLSSTGFHKKPPPKAPGGGKIMEEVTMKNTKRPFGYSFL
jgi:hypothetical protein